MSYVWNERKQKWLTKITIWITWNYGFDNQKYQGLKNISQRKIKNSNMCIKKNSVGSFKCFTRVRYNCKKVKRF